MKVSVVKLSIFVLLPGISAAQQREPGSDLSICNESDKASIQVAYVQFLPMRALLGMRYSWEGGGWVNVRPNRCRTLFEDVHRANAFWLRIESGNRVIVAEGDKDVVHAVNEKFCFLPGPQYSWRMDSRTEASTNCRYGTHPGIFNFYVKFNDPTNYTLRINPDNLGRGPVEKFGLTPSERDVKQSITHFIPTDIAGSARWPAFRETIQRANAVQNRPKILICTYFNKQYSFWYGAPPDNINEFVRLDMQSGGGLSGIGMDGLNKCPADEAEAGRVESMNKEKWRQAALKLPR